MNISPWKWALPAPAVALWLLAAGASAQSPLLTPEAPPLETSGEPALIPGVPPGPPPPADQVQNIAYQIGVKLRCPVCQGMSVADSTSTAAVQMQLRIRELVAAGYSEDQIQDFFVERYGEWILLQPEREGLNLLIWILPALLAVGGAGWALYLTMRWGREPDDVPLPSDVGLVPKDRYEERLLAELQD